MQPRAAGQDRFDGCIAVFEATESSNQRAREVVFGLDYRLAVESSQEALWRRFQSSESPDVLLVSLPESTEFVDRVLALPRAPVVIASLSGPIERARERFHGLRADLYTIKPHSTESLAPILHAAGMLALSRWRNQALKSAESRLRDRLQEAGHSPIASGFQHFEFFKRLLVLEIKRAKRYEYSVAVCMVKSDPMPSEVPMSARERLENKVAGAIIASIRDIDIPVDYTDDHKLLFLPYTDAQGAREVGGRVLDAVRRTARTRLGSSSATMTVSVGIASMRSGEELSFSRILRDANAALRAAQLKGGNQCVARHAGDAA